MQVRILQELGEMKALIQALAVNVKSIEKKLAHFSLEKAENLLAKPMKTADEVLELEERIQSDSKLFEELVSDIFPTSKTSYIYISYNVIPQFAEENVFSSRWLHRTTKIRKKLL